MARISMEKYYECSHKGAYRECEINIDNWNWNSIYEVVLLRKIIHMNTGYETQ